MIEAKILESTEQEKPRLDGRGVAGWTSSWKIEVHVLSVWHGRFQPAQATFDATCSGVANSSRNHCSPVPGKKGERIVLFLKQTPGSTRGESKKVELMPLMPPDPGTCPGVKDLEVARKKVPDVLARILAASSPNPNWTIDSANSAATFTVRHETLSSLHGFLGPVTGEANVNEQDMAHAHVKVSIDVAGLSTNLKMRDDKLRDVEFFNVRAFPAVTFASTQVERTDTGKLKVTGELTIKNVTRQIVLEGELTAPILSTMTESTWRRGFSGKTTIKLSDFEFTKWNVKLASGGNSSVTRFRSNSRSKCLRQSPRPCR